MSARHRRPTLPAAGSSALLGAGVVAGVAGVAGIAGVATVISAVPAGAAPGSHPAANPRPAADVSTTTSTISTPADDDSTSTEVPAPDYGFQKPRVGVRVKDGSYVPDGTTTEGTKLHVKITDDNGDEVPGASFDCVTEDFTPADSTDPTYCPGETSTQLRGVARRAGVRANAVTERTPDYQAQGQYTLAPGWTATVSQVTVNDNLVIDGDTPTVQPCEANGSLPTPLGPVPVCDEAEGSEGSRRKSTDVIFDDPGLPPIATDDSATTSEDAPVSIAIDGNDTPNAPVIGVKLVSAPQHGKVGIGVTDDGALRRAAAIGGYGAQYTPAPGFNGVDSFTYSITTANGTATATVHVKVVGVDDPTVPPTSESRGIDPTQSRRPASMRDSRLADTGLPGNDLVEYGVALLLAGAGATVAGVRRRRGRHAR